MERKTRRLRSLDNGGCGLKKNERKKIRSSSMIRFEKIRSNSSPLRESIRYVTFQHGSRTEAKQRMMIRFQSAVEWFRFGNDNSPSLELVAILGDFTPLRQRSGFWYASFTADELLKPARDQSSRADNYPPDCYLPRDDNNRVANNRETRGDN